MALKLLVSGKHFVNHSNRFADMLFENRQGCGLTFPFFSTYDVVEPLRNAPSTCKASIKLQNVKGPLSGDGNVTVLVGHS